MKTLSEVIRFKKELFFGGAVQVDWFTRYPEKRDEAAVNFVFHGPEYFGVSKDDIHEAREYTLKDTVTLTAELIQSLEPGNANAAIALAIAGYGAGKSHYSLTLARLLSHLEGEVHDRILENLQSADPKQGAAIRETLSDWSQPVLVIPINGMNNFDLADELTRQTLIQLKAKGLDTSSIEELSPRFQIAEAFVERNFESWKSQFLKELGHEISAEIICQHLQERDDFYYKKVNDIYKKANGYPIPVMGAESPKQLIEVLCEEYCGENKPFRTLFILFDEFGRYLEFAVEKPHIAGDAALQQIYEGVQDHAQSCFMLCTIQAELKAYIQRVNPENQSAINRYVGRYDSSKKYYLSSNLETLFAHLIEKKAPQFISERLDSDTDHVKTLHHHIRHWSPFSQDKSVWREFDRFYQTVAQGCWPLHPLAVLFLSRIGEISQKRSSVSLIEEAIQDRSNSPIDTDQTWPLPAVGLFYTRDVSRDPLLQELSSSEHQGGTAYAYLAVEERYRHNLSEPERVVLLSVLVMDKAGFTIEDKSQAHKLFSVLSGLSLRQVEAAIQELSQEYGVLEWSDRFSKYHILSEAVPRSAFTRLLAQKSREISLKQIEELFILQIKGWTNLQNFDPLVPAFASEKRIYTNEWRYEARFSNRHQIEKDIQTAFKEWKEAYKTDAPRGRLIYCYLPSDAKLAEVQDRIRGEMRKEMQNSDIEGAAPIWATLLYDTEDKLRRVLSEYWVVTENLSDEEQRKFAQFIPDHKQRLKEEMQAAWEILIGERHYILPPEVRVQGRKLKDIGYELFDQTYPKVVQFPFDGFHTARGNAAKDCRHMITELFKGTLNHEWLTEQQQKQIQNRFETVIKESWQAIDETSGEISRYPKDHKIRSLISGIELMIEEEASLNLGELFWQLISPPFGFNNASACLLLGIFISPRRESLALIYQGKSIDPKRWIGQLFSGQYLDIKTKVLEDTDIKEIDTDEWGKLIGEWSVEKIYFGQAKFKDQADKLMQRIPLPAGVLRERWNHLNEKAEQSIKKLNDLHHFVDEQTRYLEIALKKGNIGNISRVGHTVLSKKREMEKEEGWRTEEDMVHLNELIDESLKYTKAYFEKWLSEQSIIKSEEIADFKHKMLKQVGKNLKSLELFNLYDQLERHVNSIILNIDERQKQAYIIDEVKAFLEVRQITKYTKIEELNGWINQAKDSLNTLESERKKSSTPQVSKLIDRLRSFEGECKKQRTKQRDRLDRFLNKDFLDIEEIKQARIELQELIGIFQSQEIELDELNKMDTRLSQLENDFSVFNDLSLSQEALEKQIRDRIEELEAKEEEDGDTPEEWRETRQIYESFLSHLLKERKKLSSEWLEKRYKNKEAISRLDANKCQQLQASLEAVPAYITPSDRETVQTMREQVQKRLDDLKIDGLLAQFQRLSLPLQRKFFEMIASKMEGGK